MSGRPLLRTAFALVLAASASACDSTPAPTDAAMGDAAILPMSRLLGRCFEDWQCPGPGAYCRPATDGYPGGSCTLPCADRTDCDDGTVYNACITYTATGESNCEAFCRGATDCLPGYTCQLIGTADGFCVPVCATDEECGGTAQCDPYTGRCVAAGTVNTTGGVTGDACGSNDSCRSGDCRQANENGNIAGFVNGYCESLCRIEAGFNTSNFFSGDTLPAGTCAGAAICLPVQSNGAGDMGVCRAECHTSSDCRPGYTCQTAVSGHTFTNGFCTPFNCNLAGNTCPMGTCQQLQDSSGNVYGRCG